MTIATPFTVATWNVNGIRARAEQLGEWAARARPDVIALQEIKAAPHQVPELLCNLDGYHCYWHGGGGYSGVALHVKRALSPSGTAPQFAHPPFDHEHRIVTATVEATTFASVYVPNGGKDFPAKLRFLEALVAWAAEVQADGRALVVMGDLNVAREERDVYARERKATSIGQLPEERALFERLLATGLVDVGRALDPDNDALFTWWAPWRNLRQRNLGWRIDYVLASRPLGARARSSTVEREFGTSDHGAVVVAFGESSPSPSA